MLKSLKILVDVPRPVEVHCDQIPRALIQLRQP
jgi:hypothetical protein